MGTATEIESLQAVSARIGSEPLLVQAATGNTSVKLDGTLWIKASGKWLAHAASDEIMVPVNLAETRRSIELNIDPAGRSSVVNGKTLGTSVETAMHAVLPWRVVLHVHSVNTIAWAVRRDGARGLEQRLDGIDWQWIPYVSSGMPLAHAIQAALMRAPRTKVLVLANHGLVVCGEDCAAAEDLLNEVEGRVRVEPRAAPEARWQMLSELANKSSWELPQNRSVHAIGTSAAACVTVSGGVLYPCQAIFLTPCTKSLPESAGPIELDSVDQPFAPIEGAGVLVRGRLNAAASATLAGLAQVVQRIPESAPVQYLRESEVRELLCADVYHYRSMVEDNGGSMLRPGP